MFKCLSSSSATTRSSSTAATTNLLRVVKTAKDDVSFASFLRMREDFDELKGYERWKCYQCIQAVKSLCAFVLSTQYVANYYSKPLQILISSSFFLLCSRQLFLKHLFFCLFRRFYFYFVFWWRDARFRLKWRDALGRDYNGKLGD